MLITHSQILLVLIKQMENKTTVWTNVFYVVLAICILQYVFLTIPVISKTENVGIGFYLGSLVPNAFIVFIFWIIKSRAEKRLLPNNSSNNNEKIIPENKIEPKLQLSNFNPLKAKFNLTSDETIILSLISATVFALLVGYKFGHYYTYRNDHKVIRIESCDYCEFEINYMLAMGTFIVVGGLTYFYLNRTTNKNDR